MMRPVVVNDAVSGIPRVIGEASPDAVPESDEHLREIGNRDWRYDVLWFEWMTRLWRLPEIRR